MRRGQFDLDVPSSRVWVVQPVIDSINVTMNIIIVQFIVKVIIIVRSAIGVYGEGRCYDHMFQEGNTICVRETVLCNSEGLSNTAVNSSAQRNGKR